MRIHRRVRTMGCRRTLVTALVAALAIGGSAPMGVAASERKVAASERKTDEVPTWRPLTVVQANINKDMGQRKFLSDVAMVYAEQPDLITFNEVHGRDDALLVPAGYEMFRTPGPRTGWAPVVWRSDTWTAVSQGTWKISDRPEKLRGKPGMVGVRYANWVTLAAADGQVVSVISAHIAPNNKDTAELLVPSLKRLRRLATDLGQLGPVILGGDLNMGYRSERYQPRFLATAGLTSTFDMLGASFVTHKRGGTIDYIFLGPTGHFVIDEQYPVLLNSDHRMIVARLQLLSGQFGTPLPQFSPGKVIANSRGSAVERRAIRSLQLRAIAATPSGAAIHVASRQLGGEALVRALIDATKRGADVTVITGRRKLSKSERQLRRILGPDSTASSYFVKSGRAWPTSARDARRRPGAYLRPTTLLISQAGATAAFALVADGNLGASRSRRSTTSTAKVTTREKRYDTLYRKYLGVVGRGY